MAQKNFDGNTVASTSTFQRGKNRLPPFVHSFDINTVTLNASITTYLLIRFSQMKFREHMMVARHELPDYIKIMYLRPQRTTPNEKDDFLYYCCRGDRECDFRMNAIRVWLGKNDNHDKDIYLFHLLTEHSCTHRYV